MVKTSPVLIGAFSRYSKWYISRNFHAVRLSLSGEMPAVNGRPLVVYLNHASWWDPLIGLLLARTFWPERQHFSPIDAAALRRYPILSRIGFFAVEANTRRGAAMFLRTGLEILGSPSAAIWITSEGQFRDPRVRPIELRAGLAHLARRNTRAAIVPLAIEYPFWDERLPEVLCRFGKPIDVDSQSRSVSELTAHLAEQMQQNQDLLAADAIARKPEAFRTILSGHVGVGFFYDALRWAIAKIKRQPFQRQHGEQST